MLKKVYIFLLSLLFSTLAYASPQVECLAKMAYFEARGESPTARRVVMDIMINRVKHHEFPQTICGNLKPSQFQWMKNNPRVRDWKTYFKIRKEAEAVYASYLLGEWRDTSRGGIFFSSNGRKPAKRAYSLMMVGGHRVYGLRALRRT